MKIAIYGTGEFSLESACRDGSVMDRRGFATEAKRAGHAVFWIGKNRDAKHHSLISGPPFSDVFFQSPFNLWGSSDYKRFEEASTKWTAQTRPKLAFPVVDALIIESRARVFNPYGAFFEQYLVLEHYLKHTDTRIFFRDFDLNTLGILRHGSDKYYPHFDEITALIAANRHRVSVLCPYKNPMTVFSKFGVAAHEFYWGIPKEYFDLCDSYRDVIKAWPLVYNGSDYNRRKAFEEFYGHQRINVGLTGVWGKKKGSTEFLATLPNVTYLGKLTLEKMFAAVAAAYAVVQIVPNSYIKVGYFTQRIIEVPFCGTAVLCDARVKAPDGVLDEAYYVRTKADVVKWLEVLADLSPSAYFDLVRAQRERLFEKLSAETLFNQFEQLCKS